VGEPKIILIVDDDDHQLLVLSDYFKFKGYEVVTARGGEKALDVLRNESVDLVLLDVMMPGMSGGDVALAIREELNLASLPIVFLTAAVDSRIREKQKGLAVGNAYVQKPFDLDKLVEVVREFLGN